MPSSFLFLGAAFVVVGGSDGFGRIKQTATIKITHPASEKSVVLALVYSPRRFDNRLVMIDTNNYMLPHTMV